MKFQKTKIIIVAAALVVFAHISPIATAQNVNANRKPTVKSEMKESGKEAKVAGKSLGYNVKRGRVVRGGKRFGKHVGRAGKHFGKGSKAAAKKTGSAVKNAAKQ